MTATDVAMGVRSGATHAVLLDGTIHAINWLDSVTDGAILAADGNLLDVRAIRELQYRCRACGANTVSFLDTVTCANNCDNHQRRR